MMAPTLEKRCGSHVAAYGRGALPEPVSVRADLLDAQARRAAMLVRQSATGSVLALPDPVGTGKTVVALTCAALLLDLRKVRRILVVAPNAVVAMLWVDRARQLNRGSTGEAPFTSVRPGQRGLRWRDGELRVVTRSALPFTPKPDGSDSFVIVDEAHRGLQNRGAFYSNLEAWVSGQRTLLVTATPFQLSTNGVLTLLAVGGGTRIRKVTPAIEEYGRGLVLLARRCAVARDEGKDGSDLESDPDARMLAAKVEALARSAREALDHFVLPPDETIDGLPRHPELRRLDQAPATGLVTPTLVGLGPSAIAHHVARTVPEMLMVGKGDMFNRQVVSSAEGFWASTAGRCLQDRDHNALEAAGVTPSAADRLATELEVALGSGADHPKVAATTSWVSARIRKGRHVLVFCVFEATRVALHAALAKELGDARVIAPSGDKVPSDAKEMFRKVPDSPKSALALVLQDRFSESIDLDGGKPCLVHHDLPWNPARLSQRWGRAVRASSDFEPIPAEDIFVPVLDTEVDRRLFETVRGRWEVGDLLLPKKSGYDENDDGHGAIPVALLQGIAGVWQSERS